MIKKYFSLLFLLLIPCIIIAQDASNKKNRKNKLSKRRKVSNRLKKNKTLKTIDSLKQKKEPILHKNINKLDSLNIVKSNILQDSIISLQKSKINQVEFKKQQQVPKLDISDVKVISNLEENPKDHPNIEELDNRWKQELYHSSLYDTIYETITRQNYKHIDYIVNLPTDTLKKRLEILNAKTPFNVEYNPALESVIKNYLKNRHQSMERLMAISDYYFPLFEEVLDKYDLPLEIKYLAIVESALKPKAKSRVGATGLWQFMFNTGREYDLSVNSYIDERMDPIKSTNASAQYLSKLYSIFNDWDLALASYNSGPGNVSKAIRRSGGYTNYWNIRPFLPRETAGYLPAFLATMYIFEYADFHNFKPKRPQFSYFQTDTVKVKQQISLNQVADFMNIEKEVLHFLNPSYKLGIIPFVKEKDYTLRLPLTRIGAFVSNENSIYRRAKEDFDKREKPLPELLEIQRKIRYRIRNGDYLGSIANKFGVRVSQIKRWNGLRNNNIRVGKYLTIYPQKLNSYSKVKNKVNSESNSYTVRSGDSLWSISQKFAGVSVETLKKINKIPGNQLKPGMRLKLK